MCIRDRARTQRTLRIADARARLGNDLSADGRSVPLRQLRSCLLYTSDAADERSSVDLGGRRIIKKKTRVERCRGRALKKSQT